MQNITKLTPPYVSESDHSYLDNLCSMFEVYSCFIKDSFSNIILKDTDFDAINHVNKSIIDSINYYLSGNSGKSYQVISKVLKENIHSFKDIAYSLNDKHSLIRLRKSYINLYKRQELFHIPFNQRYKVSKQRYSIEGLPCLYLAASSYTAWLELNKPNFTELWASAFRANSEIKLFDLSFTLSKVISDYNNSIIDNKQLVSKLKLFPFVLATSFRVKYPFEIFHEEYIISGNLLQWIVNNTDFMGIRYLSTRLDSYSNHDYLWAASNVVIPPHRYNKDEMFNGYLKNNFRITKPINCSILIAYSNAGGVTAYQIGGEGLQEETFENTNIEKSKQTDIDDLIFSGYNNTDFYNIDGYLNSIFELDYI